MSTNVKLLHKIADRIEADPAHFDLGFFAAPAKRVDVSREPDYPTSVYERVVKDEPVPTCGTVACIAGWAIIESDPKLRRRKRITEDDLWKSAEERGLGYGMARPAAKLLGLDCYDIFYDENWKERRAGRPTAANVAKQLRLLAKGKGKFADHYVE